MLQILIISLTALLSCAIKFGAIQENIWRNRKLGHDPKSKQWHFMQGLQFWCTSLGLVVAGFHFWYVLYELPLMAGFWILFQGFNNIKTFGRPWGYVGDKEKIDEHGSAVDRFFLRKANPEQAMKRAQFSLLLLSLVPIVLFYTLFR